MNAFYSNYSTIDVDGSYTVLDVPESSPVAVEPSEPGSIEVYRPPPPPPASQQSVSPVEADEKSATAESSIIHTQPIFHPAPLRVLRAQSLETAQVAPSSPEMIYNSTNYMSQAQYAHQQQRYLPLVPETPYYIEYQCPPTGPPQEFYPEHMPASTPANYDYYALAAQNQSVVQTFDAVHAPYQALAPVQTAQAIPQQRYYQFSRQVSSMPSYVHNYNPAMVPLSRHGSYGSMYTPQPSNPSSGATTPNFGYDHPSHISTYGENDSSETLISPVTPHDQPIPNIPRLMLAQSTSTPHLSQIQPHRSTGMVTPTQSHPYANSYESYEDYETYESFQPYDCYEPYPPSGSGHGRAYLPLTPVSPALPTAAVESHCAPAMTTIAPSEPDAIAPLSQNGNEGPPEPKESITLSPREALEPRETTVSPASLASGSANANAKLKVVNGNVNATASSSASASTSAITTTLTMTQAEERLKKLRERRHVVACTFCRGRKIACQATPAGTKAGTKSSAEDSKLGPKLGAKRGGFTNSSRPPCDNCLRRGRECVYPERAARHPRRRRRMVSPVQTPSPEVMMPSASSGSSAAPSPVDYSSCATSPVLSKTR